MITVSIERICKQMGISEVKARKWMREIDNHTRASKNAARRRI